jgi:hypothetical protein
MVARFKAACKLDPAFALRKGLLFGVFGNRSSTKDLFGYMIRVLTRRTTLLLKPKRPMQKPRAANPGSMPSSRSFSFSHLKLSSAVKALLQSPHHCSSLTVSIPIGCPVSTWLIMTSHRARRPHKGVSPEVQANYVIVNLCAPFDAFSDESSDSSAALGGLP